MEHQETDKLICRLAADNFTPPARTPWGGSRIRALKGLGPGPVVGESWELSFEPSFPSRAADGRALAAVVAEDRRAWLGPEAAHGASALLVKLLDADAPLSVQIHPADGWPGLAADEGGKPESWYVVHAEPGAGIHLGLAEGVTARAMERALAEEADVAALLSFVEVAPGDFYVIEAGTPHCVGAGVLLVEPQRVAPTRRGITYRYWDWGRRYAPDGRLDPEGAPRELHVRQALAVTRWDRPRGAALLDAVRRRVALPAPDAPARLDVLAGPGGLASAHLLVARVAGTGAIALPFEGHLRAVTVLSGAVEIGGARLAPGESAAIAAAFSGVARLVPSGDDAPMAIVAAALDGA